MFEVKYWCIYKDNKVKKTVNICFSSLPRQDSGIKVIRYLAPVSNGLNEEILDFYLDFVKQTFTGRNYSYKKVALRGKKYVHFSLETDDWDKYHVLVYLSAFRMIDEAEEIILEMYKNKNEKYDTQFIKFQDIHKEVCDGNITLKKNGLHTLECHGLILYSEYGGTCKKVDYRPINYTVFKDRLENRKSKSVHKYFYDDTILPKPIPPAPKVEKAADLYVDAVKPVKPLKPFAPIDRLVKNEEIFA